MQRWGVILLTVGLLIGCSPKDETPVSILSPKGAPSLALLETYASGTVEYKTVDGTDVISAELAKPEASYDMIVAPVNLGTKLIQNGSSYVLDSIVTWGNLYLIGTEDYASEPVFAAFGEAAVPQKILDFYLAQHRELSPTYFNSGSDVQAQLLTGKANLSLLAEPLASATIAKAKENGLNLRVVADLQASYGNGEGYPQAAIFVKEGSEARVSDVLKSMETFLNTTMQQTTEQALDLIEQVGVETLGVPSAQLALATWQRQNIRFVKANTVVEELTSFLSLFNIEFDSNITTK
ncbi:MAG: hypothetical protein ACRCZJ_06685 [Erysipelotrichaceae bacterium]